MRYSCTHMATVVSVKGLSAVCTVDSAAGRRHVGRDAAREEARPTNEPAHVARRGDSSLQPV